MRKAACPLFLEAVAAAGVVMAASLLGAAAEAPGRQNLVHNGGFELPADKGPPAGWVMWGAKQYKDPANYTRDTTRPHSGEACFRIHHPAGTAGYVVSDPARAIRTKKRAAYRVSFWARTDKPGVSVIYFDAYSSIRPYRDAPSPGRWPIRVGRGWQRFTVEISEGRDFFADRSRLLLLAFRPTSDRTEEKTVWLDDVTVTEGPAAARAGFLDESTLTVEPLRHRLRPGKQLAFTVDPTRRIGAATAMAGGMSFHRVAGYGRHAYDRSGRYILPASLERAVRELRLPMTRLYGVGDEPFGLAGSLDRAAEICRRMAIPQETTVLELETQSASKRLAPAVWAQAVEHCRKRGHKFRHWEISNEPYTRKATAFATPADYLAHFKAVSAAIRKARADAQIGLPIWPANPAWGHRLLKEAAGGYDFVVGHYYSDADAYKLPLEEVVLTANYRVLRRILRVNALIRAYNPKRSVCQLDTEWGLACRGEKGPEYARRNANIVGTLHRAVRLIYYAREGMLRGASGWEMFCRLQRPGFGFLSPDEPDKALMLYWLYYHFNRHVGRWALAIDGTAPWHKPARSPDPSASADALAGPLTPVLVTLSADERTLYVVAVNGSPGRPVDCRIDLREFVPARVEAVSLTQADLDAHPLVRNTADALGKPKVQAAAGAVALTLPPRSVVFLTLAAGALHGEM